MTVHLSEVDHPLYGPGRVLSYRRGGRLALVAFDSLHLPTLVPTRDLFDSAPPVPSPDTVDADDSGAGAPAAAAGEASPIAPSYDEIGASLTLEAMRLGVVPVHNLAAYTVGREAEIAAVEADLARIEDEGGAVRAFLGDYGCGKTHLLELVQQRALRAGFLTARVVLDATETAPSHPRRVYRGLVRSLRYPDRPAEEGVGLRPLFERARLSSDVREHFMVDDAPRLIRPGANPRPALEAGMHLYLSAALSLYEQLTAEEIALRARRVDPVPGLEPEEFRDRALELLFDWLEGHPTACNADINDELASLRGRLPWLYSLMDFRPWARIYSYILSGLSQLARLCGYAGLVVLLDEAELYSLLSSENREYARLLFKALSCAALGPEAVPFDTAALDAGGNGILQELPPRYGTQPGLYTVFAMTPNERGIDTLHDAAPRDCISELAAMDDHDYRELARRVCDFYASARRDAVAIDSALVTRIEQLILQARRSGQVGNARQAMKLVIELLDVHRYHGAGFDRVVKNLQHAMF